MRTVLDSATTLAISDSVHAIERCSCAEIVVEIRSRSGSYAHADARFASLVALVALIVLLFSPWTFRAGWVVIDVAIAWAIGWFIASRSDFVRRAMTSEGERDGQVHLLASSVFHDRGVANTQDETGVLVYLSLLERRMEVLADRGVLKGVPSLAWNQIVAIVRARRAGTETLLETLRALTPLLEQHLPIKEGDVDELCNVPRFVSE